MNISQSSFNLNKVTHSRVLRKTSLNNNNNTQLSYNDDKTSKFASKKKVPEIFQMEFKTIIPEITEDEGYSDEHTLMIKKYRKHFEEVEKDRAVKELQMKEIELKKMEVEKKRHKFAEETGNRAVYIDYEGKPIKVKQPPLIKVAQPNDKFTDLPILSKDSNYFMSSGELKLRFSPNKFSIPETFYQANPLVAYELTSGVDLEYYGIKNLS